MMWMQDFKKSECNAHEGDVLMIDVTLTNQCTTIC